MNIVYYLISSDLIWSHLIWSFLDLNCISFCFSLSGPFSIYLSVSIFDLFQFAINMFIKTDLYNWLRQTEFLFLIDWSSSFIEQLYYATLFPSTFLSIRSIFFVLSLFTFTFNIHIFFSTTYRCKAILCTHG